MKTALRRSIWAFFILLIPLVASAAQFEFKGIPMGVSEAVVKEKFPGANCEDDRDKIIADRTCLVVSESFADLWNNVYFYLNLYKDKLHNLLVTLNSSDFDHATDALKSKYGAPSTTKTQQVHNAMGAAFTNYIYRWQLKDGTITALRYLNDIDTAGIIYSTYFYDQEFSRRNRKAKDKAKKDL